MCTENAKFLKKEIPVMRGWKVLLDRGPDGLISPCFGPGTPWVVGEKRFRNEYTWFLKDSTCGFHFFRSRYAAQAFKSYCGPSYVVVPVLAEKVIARGDVAGWITWLPFRTYIAKEITLLETPS